MTASVSKGELGYQLTFYIDPITHVLSFHGVSTDGAYSRGMVEIVNGKMILERKNYWEPVSRSRETRVHAAFYLRRMLRIWPLHFVASYGLAFLGTLHSGGRPNHPRIMARVFLLRRELVRNPLRSDCRSCGSTLEYFG
jgi:hypothetical protein